MNLNEIEIDDYNYALELIEYYANDKLSFDEFLDVLPTTINLKSSIEIVYDRFYDKTICKNYATKIINHYHSRLMETNYFQSEDFFSKLLTIKEIFFLTNVEQLEKLVTGKEINLGQEIREAFEPIKKEIPELMQKKVLGNSRSKLAILIKPYNSIFNEQQFLKYKPAIYSKNENITYISHEMVHNAEMFLAHNELFPAKLPTEKQIFKICKQSLNDELEKTE